MWLSIFVTWVCGQNYEPEFKKNTYAEVAALALISAGMFISGTQMYGSGRGYVNELRTSVNSGVLTEVNVGVREASSRQSGIDKGGSGTELVVYDPEFATRQLLDGGTVSESSLRSIVPKDTSNTFVPSNTIAEGYKYSFNINGTNMEIKWHSPDLNAAAK